jgi:hypothetical protein
MAPPQTTLKQTSNVTRQLDGTQRFEILSHITFVKAGDLPHGDVFVNQIINTTNPKTDKFLRVAQVGDLTNLPRGRDKALEQEKSTYVASTNVSSYSSLIVAVQAKKVLQARIDELIYQWKLYSQQLISPDEFEFPLVPSSIVNAAKDTYYAAKGVSDTKDIALLTAQADYSLKNLLATRAASDLNAAIGRQSSCAQIQSLMTAAVTGENAFRTAAVAFSAAASTFESGVNSGVNPTFEANIATFNTAITAEASQGQAILSALQSMINTECANETTAVTTAAAAKTTADAALASAQTTLTVAQAEATAAQADEDAALAAVIDVCPDFEP